MLDRLVFFTVYDEAYSEYVEDSFKRNLLFLHLLIDGQGSLCADLELVLDALVRKLLLERLYELCHKFLPVPFGALELVCYGSVLFRFGITEIDIFQFTLDVIQA